MKATGSGDKSRDIPLSLLVWLYRVHSCGWIKSVYFYTYFHFLLWVIWEIVANMISDCQTKGRGIANNEMNVCFMLYHQRTSSKLNCQFHQMLTASTFSTCFLMSNDACKKTSAVYMASAFNCMMTYFISQNDCLTVF